MLRKNFALRNFNFKNSKRFATNTKKEIRFAVLLSGCGVYDGRQYTIFYFLAKLPKVCHA